MMNRRILIGVDANLSPPTQLALRVAADLLERTSMGARLVLLHVIPVPHNPSPVWGKSIADLHPFSPAPQQRQQAERVLWSARRALEQCGIARERIEWLQRAGTPADAIAGAAGELGVDRIVIGSRGNTLPQRLRRAVLGSTSRRVLRLAPCPVTLVVLPRPPHASNLVAWYREAVTRSLQAHPGPLLAFTACDVAQQFAPRGRTVSSREVEAATQALEQLASKGLLCCHKIRGELRYLND